MALSSGSNLAQLDCALFLPRPSAESWNPAASRRVGDSVTTPPALIAMRCGKSRPARQPHRRVGASIIPVNQNLAGYGIPAD